MQQVSSHVSPLTLSLILEAELSYFNYIGDTSCFLAIFFCALMCLKSKVLVSILDRRRMEAFKYENCRVTYSICHAHVHV